MKNADVANNRKTLGEFREWLYAKQQETVEGMTPGAEFEVFEKNADAFMRYNAALDALMEFTY